MVATINFLGERCSSLRNRRGIAFEQRHAGVRAKEVGGRQADAEQS